ncbi:MAG: SdrD B-like domain-containing protein, partial [Candidatus Omnitrophica bacterium]|nr:SdrD B-like domain-containing protein [Candidatus Omnitrophota bacterium]
GTVLRKNIVRVGKLDAVNINYLDGSGTARYFGDLYSLENEWVRSDRLRFSTTQLFIDNHTELDEQSGKTNYPRNNIVSIVDTDYLLYPKLNFYNTFGQSVYNRDDKTGTVVGDVDYRTGFRFVQDRYTFNSAFEYVGSEYASLNIPSTYQDYLGGDVSTQFTMCDYWNLSLAANLNKDNVDHLADSQTTFGKTFSIGNNFNLPWQQNVSLYWNYNSTLSRGAGIDTTGNEYNNYTFDYFKTFGELGLQLSYQYFRSDPLGMTTGSNFFHLYSFSVYKFFPNMNGSYVRFYQDMRKTKQLSQGFTPDLITYDTNISMRYYIFRNFNINAECRMRATEQDAVKNAAIVTLNAGIEYSPVPEARIGFTYMLDNVDLFIKNRTTRDYSLLLTARYLFDIQSPEKWGTVRIYVFEDKNNNGRLDAGEAIPDCLVYIIKGRYARTDAQGKAVIRKVVPGIRDVQIDLRGLPVELMVKGPQVQSIPVSPLKTSEANFVLVRTGTVRGRVFIDANKNGVFDKETDAAVPNVHISLVPSGGDTITFSDGSYVMEYVSPGSYDVTINTATLPKDTTLISPQNVPIDIAGEESKNDINFLLEEKKIEAQYF